MKLILGVVVLTLACLAAAEFGETPKISTYDFHRRVGIPRAAAIKKAEDAMINSQSRIINGSPTDIKETPYQVGLLLTILIIYQSACGGSLIAADRVVTAAHCITDGLTTASSAQVVAGSNTLFYGGSRVTTKDFTVHPSWFPLFAWNDIALIKLELPLTLSDSIQPISLPVEQINEDFVGLTALTSGYGKTSDSVNINQNQVLSSTTLNIVSNSVCSAEYGVATLASNVCTQGENNKAVCSGDSGGPLAVQIDGKPVLVGVTSYGHKDGCEFGFPNAFARVTSFLPWIQSNSN